MNLKELVDFYEKAVKDYADALTDRELDDFDLEHLKKPHVMLSIENPEPKEGSAIVVLPGLEGKVFSSVVEYDKDKKVVTTIVEVSCEELGKYLKNMGMKVVDQEEIIVSRLKSKGH